MSRQQVTVVRTETRIESFDSRVAAEKWIVKQAVKDESDREKGLRVDYEIWTSPHPASE